MILIADSGATKTEWRIINDKDNVSQALTEGISPQYEGRKEISDKLLLAVEKNVLPREVDAIYFYGAGILEKRKDLVKKALLSVIEASKCEVYSDLIGVSRSLCGKDKGIACILGTGSSSCFFDGKEAKVKIPSLGYILGDEGSGAYLGKVFLVNVLRNNFSEKVTKDFQDTYQLDQDKILFSLKNEVYPSRYLASFARFIHSQMKDKQIYQLVYQAFTEFCTRLIIPYEEHRYCQAHFCGSVAFHFSDVLIRVCKEQGITVGNISKSPIAGLTLFHLESQH